MHQLPSICRQTLLQTVEDAAVSVRSICAAHHIELGLLRSRQIDRDCLRLVPGCEILIARHGPAAGLPVNAVAVDVHDLAVLFHGYLAVAVLIVEQLEIILLRRDPGREIHADAGGSRIQSVDVRIGQFSVLENRITEVLIRFQFFHVSVEIRRAVSACIRHFIAHGT